MAGSRRLTTLSAPIVDAARRHLANRDVVVALSGGADSATAAWSALEVADSVRAIHVDHGWPHSRWLREAAAAVAGRLGVDLEILEVEVPPIASPENAARIARYEALVERVPPEQVVVTAHTADDQAETVIANLARGAGLAGTAGIPAIRDRFMRPYLGVRRQAMREVAALLALPYLDDPANADRSFRRVRIRRLLSDWERSLDRPLVPGLARAASLAADDAALLEHMAADIPVLTDGTSVAIAVGPLVTSGEPVATRVIRRALRVVLDGQPGTRKDVYDVLDVARNGGVREITDGITVRLAGQRVRLTRSALPPPPGGPVDLEIGSTVRFGPWRISAEQLGERPVTLRASRRHEVFDADEVSGPFVVRSPEPGDGLRMREGTKRLVEALAEAGIEQDRRAGWPVVVSDGTCVWVPDVKRASLGWVTGTTRRYLVLAASQEERWTPVEF
jgi:tRNA(Ile)-lysidine synthase